MAQIEWIRSLEDQDDSERDKEAVQCSCATTAIILRSIGKVT
jgi:hypothetical protein